MLASLQHINFKNIDFKNIDFKKYTLALKNKYKNIIYAKNSVFLDGNNRYTNINDKVDIVLSPKFYWVRKVALPVKSVSKALKIVPDFFNDVLPQGNYKYKVIKSADEFLLFAYEESVILDAIKNSGINITFVNKIFFAQTEFSNFGAINVSNNDVLYYKDNILVKLPANIFTKDIQAVSIDYAMQDIAKSTIYITISVYEDVIATKTSQIVIVALSFIMVFYFLEYMLMKQKLSALITTKNNIVKKYNIPSSTIVFNSLLKSLGSKKEKSITSRQDLYSLLKVPLKTNDYLKIATFKTSGKDKLFFIQIILADAKNATHYKDYFKTKFQIKSIKVNGELLAIKGKK